MAKIKVVSDRPLIDGMAVTFRAPCECSAVDGLTVTYLGSGKNFTFRDAHGNDLTGLGNLFSEGVLVKAVLDVTNGTAHILNADTNGYQEEKFETALRMTKLWENASPDSTFAAQTLPLDLSNCIGVFVRYKGTKSGSGYYASGFIPMGAQTIIQAITSSGTVNNRAVRANTTGVVFYDGKTSGDTTDGTVIIPAQIYGLKGVIV